MTNANLHVFYFFRHVKQGGFSYSHTEFKENFQNSEPSDSEGKATESPPERKKTALEFLRAMMLNEAYMQICSEYPERHTVLPFSFKL